MSAPDIIANADQANRLCRRPLLILENVEAFLDAHALGTGPLSAVRIGEGAGSNFSFLLERDRCRLVLRRPPRPPLPPSAHDMVREARLQLALASHPVRLPTIRAVCEDDSVIGVPFYVMDYLEGHVITSTLPPGLETQEAHRRLGLDLVEALVEIHAVDVQSSGVSEFVRPGSYLERQVRRFSQLWQMNRTRDLPTITQVGTRLARTLPEPLPLTVVHGDYRLGNVIVATDDPSRVSAVLDWEMGAVGDPRADVGYLLATYSEPGGQMSPLDMSPVTGEPGFPSKSELVDHYVRRSGRDLNELAWFQALALWKAAIFCEAIYGRFIRDELSPEDHNAARFEAGVPLLAEGALAFIA